MKLGNLIDGAGIISCTVDLSDDISTVVSNADGVSKRSLFVCRRGSKHDSHFDIPLAMAHGCACVVSENSAVLRLGIPAVLVYDIRHAEAVIYSNFYKNPAEKLNIIAVTGTNGKSSVCGILKAIAEKCGETTGVIGTLGAYIGDRRLEETGEGPATTPSPEEFYRLLSKMYTAGVRSVCLEASSHALDQRRLDGITAEVGVFTNLSRDHLEYHVSMNEYLKAKLRLFDLSERCFANADDPSFAEVLKTERSRKITAFSADAGKSSIAEYCALKTENHGIDGVSYRLSYPGGNIGIVTPMPGKYALYNTLAAASASIAVGRPPDKVAEAIASFRGVRGRMEKIVSDVDFGLTVFIDYAHTPDALAGAIATLRSIGKQRRLVVLFGCGGDRDAGKRRIMGHIASSLADIVIITDDNPRTEDPARIRADIIEGMDGPAEIKEIPDRKSAIEYAIKNAHPKDVILLAGKGHEEYEITSSGKRPFSERDEVLRLLG